MTIIASDEIVPATKKELKQVALMLNIKISKFKWLFYTKRAIKRILRNSIKMPIGRGQ